MMKTVLELLSRFRRSPLDRERPDRDRGQCEACGAQLTDARLRVCSGCIMLHTPVH